MFDTKNSKEKSWDSGYIYVHVHVKKRNPIYIFIGKRKSYHSCGNSAVTATSSGQSSSILNTLKGQLLNILEVSAREH